jgi:hypothetical protein
MKSYKLTRNGLQELISEEIQQSESVLLEMPLLSTTGITMNGMDKPTMKDKEMKPQKDRDDTKRVLYHMSQQSQQLHDMMTGEDNLEDWAHEALAKASAQLEKVFKTITYEMGPGQGRLGE